MFLNLIELDVLKLDVFKLDWLSFRTIWSDESFLILLKFE